MCFPYRRRIPILVVVVVELRLRMISEALELYVEVGRVSHSWCMCVITHCNGVLVRGRDEGGGWNACRTNAWELVACREMPVHFPSVR